MSSLRRKKRTSRRLLALGGSVALVAAVAGQSRERAARPTGPVTTCTTSGCHDAVTAHRVVHGPVNVGCDACHVAADEVAHTFTLSAPGNVLCMACHGDEVPLGAAAHAPGFDGQCLDCHDPHGGETVALFRREAPGETGDTCRSCHVDRDPAFEPDEPGHRHANGDCRMCHTGHAREHPQLLVERGAALCNGCHADTLGLSDADARYVHGPAAVTCVPCHDPHGSEFPALTRSEPVALCLGCHADTIGDPETVAHGHAGASGAACLDCHEAHRADHAGLLRRPEIDLCLHCHAVDLERADGSVVPGVAALARTGSHRHAAMDAGCSGCHDAHGDFGERLLVGGFTTAPYHAVDQAAYGLCLACHDAAAFQDARSAATAFRDGDVNLHYLHTAGQGDRARNCRFCHEPHGGEAPRLMRQEAPFGAWAIPIGFEALPDGGSCAAGCHRERRYRR